MRPKNDILLVTGQEIVTMKLTVLVDNNTLIDRYYLGEPGLSFYIEDGDRKILFDTGYSNAFVINAKKMNIDLEKVDTVVLSHGHNDHTGGLKYIRQLPQEIDLYCHPLIDEYKEHNGLDISMPLKPAELPANFRVHRERKPVMISEHIMYLGEIERTIQKVRPLGNDYLYDDTAMVYVGRKGSFIITACSHSGIINIVEYVKKLTGNDHITGIIGGFHMQNDEELNREVCQYMKDEDIEIIYPCHCTDLKAKIALGRVCRIAEIGVSTCIEINE